MPRETCSRAKQIEHETTRLALVLVLRDHPDWTLADLFERMDRADRHARALRKLTVQDLATSPAIEPVEPAIAMRARGPKFDGMVLRVVLASTHPVKACDLRARLGGPRWKLQASLRRLARAGKIQRTGKTADTHYHASDES